MLKHATRTSQIVQAGWEAVARGDWDTLIADYIEDMVFVMPGQADVLHGRAAFRAALEGIGGLLPKGFAIASIREIGEGAEVVSIVEWTCDRIPQGSQLAVLFKFQGDKIAEERWFIDTAQWRAAF